MAKSTQIAGYGNARILRFRKTALAFALSQILNMSVPAAMAATIAVDTDSGGANDPNHCTLRDAITAANADAATGGCPAGAGADTIVLPAKATITLTEPDNPHNGLPVVTSVITIEGNGTTISRNSSSPEFRIFEANHRSLELRNIIISGGYIYSGGGGIAAHNSSHLTLINSTVSGNSAMYSNGGGISVTDTSPVTLINSTVSGNRNGGNIDSTIEGGAGIDALESPVTLISSTVSGNKSGPYGTGGIAVWSSTVTLTNSTVSGNTGEGIGGIRLSNSTLNLTNSTVSGNAGVSGAGIITYDSILNLMNSTVSGNTSYFRGGIFALDGILKIVNSTITDNSNQNSVTGGGVELRRSSYSSHLEMQFFLQNNIITANNSGDCINNTEIVPTAINNLIGDGGINCGTPLLTGDPKLGPLRKNGGPTETHALLADSPAIDAGDDAICDTLPKNARGQPTDQRGRPRAGPRAGSHCDIGAYEFRHRRRE